tara:strand:- start:58 stop:186 length:129 start_codon:yes stop_codon:yes gene_type:complete
MNIWRTNAKCGYSLTAKPPPAMDSGDFFYRGDTLFYDGFPLC